METVIETHKDIAKKWCDENNVSYGVSDQGIIVNHNELSIVMGLEPLYKDKIIFFPLRDATLMIIGYMKGRSSLVDS